MNIIHDHLKLTAEVNKYSLQHNIKRNSGISFYMQDLSIENINVVILVGGLGKRLRKFVSDRPKPMANIGDRPFLDILINYVLGYGFKRIILCTGYMSSFIYSYYQNAKRNIEFVFSPENKPLGTGGAIKNAEPLIKSDPFIVMNGDSFCPVDLVKFVEFYSIKRSIISMVAVTAEKTEKYGSVFLDSSQKVIRFEEKIQQRGLYINAGIYLFDRSVFTMIPACTRFSLEYDLFPKVVGDNFFAYTMENELIDIGTPEEYAKAQNYFAVNDR